MKLSRVRDHAGLAWQHLDGLWQPFWLTCAEWLTLAIINAVVIFHFETFWMQILLVIFDITLMTLSMHYWSNSHNRPEGK